MTTRSLAQVGTLAAFVSFAVPIAGQSPVPPKPAVKAGWKAPRTPWGDPDLQGNFTNKYEQGTPMERPAQFGGRRVQDINGEELTEVLKKRQADSDARAPFLAGDPTGRIRGNAAFGDRDNITQAHRAWMIVEPGDGKIPPTTAAAPR